MRKDLVNICFLLCEAKLAATFLHDFSEKVVLEKLLNQGIVERFVCLVSLMKFRNVGRVKKTRCKVDIGLTGSWFMAVWMGDLLSFWTWNRAGGW